MKKGMRIIAYLIAVVMILTGLFGWGSSEVQAAVKKETMTSAQKMPFQKNRKKAFDTPSGYVIGESVFDRNEVKGVVKVGETVYEMETTLAVPHGVSMWPLVNYNKTDDEEYNASIEDLTSDFQITKDGEPVEFYQYDDQISEFDENDQRVSQMKLNDYVDGYVTSYTANAILNSGTYKFTITLPKEVTKGARIYFLTTGVTLNDKYTSLNRQNTKEEAIKLKVPRDGYDDKLLIGIFQQGSSNTFWYKFTLPAKRYVIFSTEGMQFTEDTAFDLTLYQPDGTTKVYHSNPNYNSTSEDNGDGWYWTGAGIKRKLEKGTYYVKLQATKDVDGYYFAGVDLRGPASPNVTYWAIGKRIVKGTAEEGSRAYAVINKKTYKAAKKTDSKGKFSIKIPNVKAGTKIKVYIKDAAGVKSYSTEVVVRKIPKAPTATSYKKGTKTIQGRALAYGTVKIVYNGKTYRKEANWNNRFTIKTKDTLKSGKKFRISVTDESGNVSKTRTYKIK